MIYSGTKKLRTKEAHKGGLQVEVELHASKCVEAAIMLLPFLLDSYYKIIHMGIILQRPHHEMQEWALLHFSQNCNKHGYIGL